MYKIKTNSKHNNILFYKPFNILIIQFSFALKKLKMAITSHSDFENSNEMREAKLYFKLPENEHIIKYEDCFFDQSNLFYLVLEYCEGGSLETKIKNTKVNFSNETILKWSKEMISAIEFLHSYKIIHRDIKPA